MRPLCSLPPFVVLVASFLVACGDGLTGLSDGGDAGEHDAGEHDAGDLDAGRHDAGPADAGDHDAGSTDAGAADAGSTDAGATDAGSTFNGVPGQCATAADCATGGCQGNAPGGFCNQCVGEDPACGVPGSGETYSCALGSCLQDCVTSADCPTGLACTSTGLCGLRSCATTPCPAPYVCDSTFSTPRCVRPACATSAECPGLVACRGGYCIVEP